MKATKDYNINGTGNHPVLIQDRVELLRREQAWPAARTIGQSAESPRMAAMIDNEIVAEWKARTAAGREAALTFAAGVHAGDASAVLAAFQTLADGHDDAAWRMAMRATAKAPCPSRTLRRWLLEMYVTWGDRRTRVFGGSETAAQGRGHRAVQPEDGDLANFQEHH